MPIPALLLLKDHLCENSELGNRESQYDLPFKNVSQTYACSTVITEITDEDKEEIDALPPGCLPNGAERLIDLSHRQLQRFPVRVFSICTGLEFLYLQENCLESLPEELFTTFPMLRRLDVRRNKLTSIPANIGDHPSLEVLLLQGYCRKLRNLQLQGNPLQWPDEKTVKLGTERLLAYLRKCDKSDTECEDDDGRKSGVSEFATTNDRGDLTEKSLFLTLTKESEAAKHTTNVSYQREGESCRSTASIVGLQDAHFLSNFTSKSSLPRRKSSRLSTSDHEQATLVCRRGQFPLGYKKKNSHVQPQQVYVSLLEQLWNDILQEEMLYQNSSLQRLRDGKTLTDWRKKARLLQIISKNRRKPIVTVPFDHEEGLEMMTWRDLIHARNQSLEKKGHSKPHSSVMKAPDPSERVFKLLQDLDKLKEDNARLKAQPDFLDRSEYQFNLGRQMCKMQELQKCLLPLRLL